MSNGPAFGHAPPCVPGEIINPQTGMCEPAIQRTVNIPILDQEADFTQEARLLAAGYKASGVLGAFWADFWASILRGLALLIVSLVSLLDFVLSKFAELVFAGQGTHTPGFYALLAAVIHDLTGVPVDGEALFQAFQTRGVLGSMDSVGEGIFNLLALEFSASEGTSSSVQRGELHGLGISGLPTATLSPEQGVAGARRFLGYVMSFAIREGNIAFFTDLMPGHWLSSFREYGENMARGLGLGRLLRVALRPLMQTLIATPLEWALNKQYHPKLLDMKEAFALLFAGRMSEDAAREELERQGWSPAKQLDLRFLHGKRLTEVELDRLVRYDKVPPEDYRTRLGWMGFEGAEIDLQRQAFIAERSDRRNEFYINILRDAFLHRQITEGEFADRIVTFGVTREERDAIALNNRLLENIPRRRLNLRQMSQAFLDGIVDLTEWTTYLTDEGYSDDDKQILTIGLLAKLRHQAEAQAAHDALLAQRAARRAARAAAAPPPTPPATGTPSA